MSESIEEILKRIAADTSPESTPNSSNTEMNDSPEVAGEQASMTGDPECPHCGGLGYLRQDLPVGHTDFGKVLICPCRHSEISQRVRERLFAISDLNELRDLSFDNFQPRGRIGLAPLQADSLEQAYNHAKQFATSQDGWLLIQGGYGSGKTHLAAAIANFAVEMGVPSLFITVPDLLDSLRYAYERPDVTFEDRFEEIRRAQLLILDDFGTQNATSWAQEKLFQILNFRYINRLPLIVTTNLSLEQMEGRIRSRLNDPELVTRVHILATDYRRPMDDTGQPQLSSLSLHHDRTFGNFNLRKGENIPESDLKSMAKAFEVARDFAENPSGWLVLIGQYGSGKTHLAAAIANYQAGLGHTPLFVVVPDLLDHLRATFSPSSTVSYDRRFEEIRTTPLLILDDLGTQAMTSWVKEKLYQLFNHRYNAQLPTVITTADDLEQVDPRLRSRMLDQSLCTIYAITVPAYRGKKKARSRKKK